MKRKFVLSTTQTIILSFLAVIMLGSLLLMMPVMSASGRPTPFDDACFTATSSVCVTGLVTVPTFSHWSLIGKIMILCLIQIGGMGTIMLATAILIAVNQKISLHARLLIQDAFNLNNLQGLVHFMSNTFKGILIVEAFGALAYSAVFIPEYGTLRGLWYSVFHAVSAFCNAGLDILGETSLEPYVHNIWLCTVTMILIVLGGLGFTVWQELLENAKKLFKQSRNKKRLYLSQHAKTVLVMTALLIAVGCGFFLLFEYNNPKTIGNFSFGRKVLAALFQSVTTRTAGFATIPQASLLTPSVILSTFLMFIGGSPSGTAGGIKTTTVAVLCLELRSVVRGEKYAHCFKRRILHDDVRKAFAVFAISLITSFLALLLLTLFQQGAHLDIFFEVYSALGTVGLSRDFTTTLNLFSKFVIIACMFFGRVAPISIMFALSKKSLGGGIEYARGNIRVG